jgi:hypothetical protein
MKLYLKKNRSSLNKQSCLFLLAGFFSIPAFSAQIITGSFTGYNAANGNAVFGDVIYHAQPNDDGSYYGGVNLVSEAGIYSSRSGWTQPLLETQQHCEPNEAAYSANCQADPAALPVDDNTDNLYNALSLWNEDNNDYFNLVTDNVYPVQYPPQMPQFTNRKLKSPSTANDSFPSSDKFIGYINAGGTDVEFESIDFYSSWSPNLDWVGDFFLFSGAFIYSGFTGTGSTPLLSDAEIDMLFDTDFWKNLAKNLNPDLSFGDGRPDSPESVISWLSSVTDSVNSFFLESPADIRIKDKDGNVLFSKDDDSSLDGIYFEGDFFNVGHNQDLIFIENIVDLDELVIEVIGDITASAGETYSLSYIDPKSGGQVYLAEDEMIEYGEAHTFNVSSIGASVPEPSIIALFGLGLVGFGFARRRRQS